MSHLTIAASEKAFEQLFIALRNHFSFATSGNQNFGPFSANYSVKFHLDKGSVQLNNDGSIEIKALDVVWDILKLNVCFVLPGLCVGGFSIDLEFFELELKKYCVGGPICVPLDLSGLVSEISRIRARLEARYFIDPGRLPAWSDYDAEFNGKPNKWQIFIVPQGPAGVSVDPIDVPASIANVFESAVKNAIDKMIPSWVPGWGKDYLWDVLGPIADLIKKLLNIVDTIEDFIQDLLGDYLDLPGIIQTAVAGYFANKYPVYEFEDPYPVLDKTAALIPVKIPLRNLSANVNSKEMVVTADVG